MPNPSFLIVDDDDPSAQSSNFKEALKLSGLKGSVDFAASPAKMLEKLRGQEAPSVILLDLHWPDFPISSILEGVRNTSPESRVVLHTGKSIEPELIIACARGGVAEYLVKSTLPTDRLVQKLWMLAERSDNTIRKLCSPTGTFQQLIQESEKTSAELRAARKRASELEDQNKSLRGKVRGEILLLITRFTITLLYFAAFLLSILYLAKIAASISGYTGVIVMGIIGWVVIDRSIVRFVFDGRRQKVELDRSGRD